ncbi:MAG TPA: tRNA (adenosine(37)-N6)-threonylcarbamoyltransferase complex dimerization subunit type 1 TsaB [Oscillatoriales cyanobacterium M59_W2019_021]|nr:MAG: tRNA (adenosine(37)-N6)-threonylcarbamoyltransferase complex dimerization subunit type 1 TsaB [Cyanobacteria bacterium J055]HIK33361.1 tRNA (adenosine(37)-N6)-threonylcarbamoyltransferase complex dimerization subunit type 1 TsaB [Oscillatoriales cyanobacterium M4454_W2019_049]HIK52391.1 tRNA (adenosine(37)-N6)-threonylcarbamoyltransferase complex dimerization subunit type 1 TsaB [Oscillatoriales cyanobacterium M59_W2019_021]
MTYGLAIHAVSPELGLAIGNGEGDLRSATWLLGRSLSTHLHSYLVEFLPPQTWSDLGFIAVAKGPGSFTSTRLGMVTARTLGAQLDIPVFAISTLAAIAHFEAAENVENSRDIAVQMSAAQGKLFTAIYRISPSDGGAIVVQTDAVQTPESWQQTLDSRENTYHLIRAESDLGKYVISVFELAYLDWKQGKKPHWSEAKPFYGQQPV